MAKQWCNVRLERDTYEQLRGLIDQWLADYDAGRTPLGPPLSTCPRMTDRISFNEQVRELIRRVAEHRDRARSARSRRKVKVRPADAGQAGGA